MARYVDPFTEMTKLVENFGSANRPGLMPMDAFEKEGEYTLKFDLAGANPDNVDLTVDSGTLTITAERPPERTDDVNWLVRERPTGTHSRQIRLGRDLDTQHIEANYDAGVLTVTIPVREEAKPYKVSIGSGSNKQLSTTSN